MLEPKMHVCIFGDTLVARHLVKYLSSNHHDVQITLWTYTPLNYSEFESIPECMRFSGFRNISNALLGCDIAINLHESTDFSLLPNQLLLKQHNVEFVRSLLFHLQSPLIHMSTSFLQCSNRWPNVYESERDPLIYKSQWPFPEYCQSKHEAELLVKSSEYDNYIIRAVPTFGEGDNNSILTDIIYFSNDKKIPQVGEDDGHMQLAYAGNVANCCWLAACRLLSHSTKFDLNSFNDELSDFVSSVENSLCFGDVEAIGRKSCSPILSPIKEEDEDNLSRKQIGDNVEADCNTSKSQTTKENNEAYTDVFDQDIMNDNTYDNRDAGLHCSESSDSMIFDSNNSYIMNSNSISEVFLVNDSAPKNTIYKMFDSFLYLNDFSEQARQMKPTALHCHETAPHCKRLCTNCKQVLLIYFQNLQATYIDDEDSSGQLIETSKRSERTYQIPFIPVYYIYLLFTALMLFIVQIIGPFSFVRKLPSPSYLYFYFRHWTFFNTSKSRQELGYTPIYSFEKSIEMSKSHYRQMQKKDVKRFSWQNSIQTC